MYMLYHVGIPRETYLLLTDADAATPTSDVWASAWHVRRVSVWSLPGAVEPMVSGLVWLWRGRSCYLFRTTNFPYGGPLSLTASRHCGQRGAHAHSSSDAAKVQARGS